MRSSSHPPVVERCRPLLGTYVAARVGGLPADAAHAAIDAAFQEVALVHSRMSFHEPGSDVSRLNREAYDTPVAVHPRTANVLRWACELAEASGGAFDVTVAAELVAWGVLPRPDSGRAPDPRASWRDIELGADGRVRFHRRLWIDLSGIAKGYAVDLAVERLRGRGAAQACVNAGGDLRVAGQGGERVLLRPDMPRARRRAAMIELENGSLASSSGRLLRRHVDGRPRRAVGADSFVSVVAERCVVADALTKAVLALGERSRPLLCRYGATAHVQSGGRAWRSFGAAYAASGRTGPAAPANAPGLSSRARKRRLSTGPGSHSPVV